MPNVYIKTLGCKVNSFDAQALSHQFVREGFVLSERVEAADFAVINSCSVTETAQKETRYLARRYRRENPNAKIVVTGCYAQVHSAELLDLGYVDFVIPNEAKTELVDYLKSGRTQKFPENLKAVSNNVQTHFKSSLVLFDQTQTTQTRAFLKVQDGCNGFCSYCLIPYARGASKSVDMDMVLNEVERLLAAGTKEIVLTGIHIGDYGVDFVEGAQTSFVELVQQIFSRLQGRARLRISSLEPGELSEDLLKVLAENRAQFCAHLHLPLQSGSRRILKLMRRSYDPEGYRNAVEMAFAYFPNMQLGADVIPGFPGETQEEFQETIDFIRAVNIHYLHVFPYSKRPNTSALRLPGHLPAEVIKARAKILQDLSAELSKKYYQKFIGESMQVLWENDVDSENRRKGLTGNYLNVVSAKSLQARANEISHVTLKGFADQRALLAQ